MKNFLFVFLLFSGKIFAQTYIVKDNSSADQSATLQKVFDDIQVKEVVISASVIVNGTLTIPSGKILKFEGGKISGKGTINGGILEANFHANIFDTTLTINPKAVDQYFSVAWFGATGNNTDDHTAIQRSINTCIKNNIRTVFYLQENIKYRNPLSSKNKEHFVLSKFLVNHLFGIPIWAASYIQLFQTHLQLVFKMAKDVRSGN